MFVEYEDATFKKRKTSDQTDKGILGPVIKGEIGDQFKVRKREIAFHKVGLERKTSKADALPPHSSCLVVKT